MNEEELIKALLQQGGIQQASPQFTAMVMQKIEAAERRSTLVSLRWKKYYRIALVAISVLVIITGLLLNGSLSQMVSNLNTFYISQSDLYTVAVFIPTLWGLLFLSRWLDQPSVAAP